MYLYFLGINLLTFGLMGYDKNQSRKQASRIPEVLFFLLSSIGGCFGFFLGMYFFHHKTKKWYFKAAGIGFLILWINLFFWIWRVML